MLGDYTVKRKAAISAVAPNQSVEVKLDNYGVYTIINGLNSFGYGFAACVIILTNESQIQMFGDTTFVSVEKVNNFNGGKIKLTNTSSATSSYSIIQ